MFRSDDGWVGTYDLYKLLKEYGIPLTVAIGPDHFGKSSQQLTAAQVREMLVGGATIAFHGAHQMRNGTYGWTIGLWGSLDAWQTQFDTDLSLWKSKLSVNGSPTCAIYPSSRADAECVPHLRAKGFRYGQSVAGGVTAGGALNSGTLASPVYSPLWTRENSALCQSDPIGQFRASALAPSWLTLDGSSCQSVDDAVARAHFVGRNQLVICNLSHQEPQTVSQKAWDLTAVRAYVEVLKSYGASFLSMVDWTKYIMSPNTPHMLFVPDDVYPNQWESNPLMSSVGYPIECIPTLCAEWLPTGGWKGAPGVVTLSDGNWGTAVRTAPDGPFDVPRGRFYRVQVYAMDLEASSRCYLGVVSRDLVTGASYSGSVSCTKVGQWMRLAIWVGPGAGSVVAEKGNVLMYLRSVGPAGTTTLFSSPSVKSCPVGMKAGDVFEGDVVGVSLAVPAS